MWYNDNADVTGLPVPSIIIQHPEESTMNRKCSAIISLLSAAVLLCGCSAVKTTDNSGSGQSGDSNAQQATEELHFIENPDYSQTSMYLDESDITSEGKVKYNIYNEYTFPDGDAPEAEYEKCVSPDGEEFYYDNEHSLRFYKNADAVYNLKEEGESTIAVMSVCFYAKDFLGAFMGARSNDLTAYDYPDNTYTVSVDAGGADAIIKFTNKSDVRWFCINYDVPPIVADEKAFSDKLDAVLKDKEDKEISRGVRYAMVEGKIYALFTVGFEAADGKKHTELYGFSDSAT